MNEVNIQCAVKRECVFYLLIFVKTIINVRFMSTLSSKGLLYHFAVEPAKIE
jgi:hypothetical protein